MADNIPLPSLSPDGWVTNTTMKADYLLSHFFTSERSRSPLFPSGVSSFQWLLQEYRSSMDLTARETEQQLRLYFGKYFPTVEVEVKAKDEVDGSSRVSLYIYVQVIDSEGKEFVLARLAEVADAKIVNILSLNNDGISVN